MSSEVYSDRPPSARARRHRIVLVAAAVLAVALVKTLLVLAAPKNQIAVFRPATAEWFVRLDDGSATRIQFGAAGDGPVAADYQGTGQPQIAVFRPSTRDWLIRTAAGATLTAQFGNEGDRPLPGDYLGMSRAQLAVFRPSTREWIVRRDDGTAQTTRYGGPDDQPVPGDYFALGRIQIALYRPPTGEWFLRGADGTTATVQWGGPGDKPVPGDYFGARRFQIAVYRPSTGEWFIRNDNGSATTVRFGGPADLPMPADYDGAGRTQIAVYRPETGEWFVRSDNGSATRVQFGGPGDVPVAAAFGLAPLPPPPPPPAPPAAPSNLTATAASQSQITLSWTDNSNNETGFRIERRTGTGAFAEIASPGANATTFASTGLTAATSYTYRVRAANDAGFSGYSNEATATTQSPPPPAISLATDLQPIFTRNCALSGCHGTSSPQLGLVLTAGSSHANLVNVDSQSVPSKKRVKPGDVANSFFFEKISQDNPSVGSRMPVGGQLSAAEIDRFKRWIEQGANP